MRNPSLHKVWVHRPYVHPSTRKIKVRVGDLSNGDRLIGNRAIQGGIVHFGVLESSWYWQLFGWRVTKVRSTTRVTYSPKHSTREHDAESVVLPTHYLVYVWNRK